MYGLCFEGQWRWMYHFLVIIWLLLSAATPPKALGYFLGDTKAVLHGCEDHWTLQDRTAMPLLFQMTVCVDIRVTVPGAWVAFSYSSVHAPRPELGLEGDDKAVYGWLLRVRHRFPVELSLTEWHRVCLRRDVPRNSFSLEVDGKMVAARTVIAQAIPPSGSLWLGCQPRDRPPGASLGEVELYMFRMWNDLDDHGLCEDGTVIGWSAQYWGLTSPRARQRDPNLLCDHRRLRRKADGGNAITTAGGRVFTTSPEVPSTTTSSSPVIAVTHMSNQTSQVTGPQLINCDIKQFCSQKNAYFWMSISVNATGGDKNERDVQNLVSSAFHCYGDSNDAASDNMDFCQAVEVNCVAKSKISTTTCDVLLQSSEAVSACEVQGKGVSALQQVEGGQIEVKIIREVERVGRYLCEDTAPSSGGFVRCTSTSSLEDICQANKASTVTCSLIEPDSNPDPQPVSESCSREVPRFCDCTAFCNPQREFFATRIILASDAVNVSLLQSLLSRQSCATMSKCQDILKYYKKVHLECHGTQERLFSCMVILEMSGPVDICSLNEFLQQLIGSNTDITNDRPLTRMVICGPPDLSVDTLLKSNLTWVDSDLLTSDVCQPDPTLLECEANEVRAVLLNEGCPHTTRQTTTQPSTLTKTSITATPVTNATEQTHTEAGNAAATEKTNASHSTVQPNMTTPLTAINSTQSSTTQPVLQTSSQNTTLSSVNSTSQITTTALIDSTLNTTTLSPNHITVYNETTADTLRPSPNETSTTTSNSTIGTFTPSPTMVSNVTTATKNYTTASNEFTKAYNVTTAHNTRNLHNGTTTISNTTIDTFTTSPNHTVEYSVTTVTTSPNHTADYNVTTITSYVKHDNSTITTTNTTISTVTSYPNYTTVKNVNTTTNNYTNNRNLKNGTTTTSNATVSSFTTSPNHTADYNVTTTSSYAKQHNSTITTTNTTMSTFTTSPNYTMVNNVTTATKNYTTAFNNYTTVDNNGNQQNATATSNTTVSTYTTSPKPTVVYNATTAASNYTTQYNVTTATNNYTTEYNVTTADNIRNLQNGTTTTSNTTFSTFTPSPNHTADYNLTTIKSYIKQDNSTITTTNTTISTVTSYPNYTTVKNVNTTINNYTNNRNLKNGTTTTSNATVSSFTTSPNHTADYNVTTIKSYVKQDNSTITTNTTISTFTSSPNYTITTTTRNYTTASNYGTTEFNKTTVDSGNQQNGTTTTSNAKISTSTMSPNHTVVYNVTTASNNYTTDYNVMTADQNNGTITTSNATTSTFTPSPNYTMVNNVTTATRNHTTDSNNYTTMYNVTTASNNYTTQYNVSTADNIGNLQKGTNTTSNTTMSTFTPSPNHTTDYNVTATSSYAKQHNSTITTTNTTMSTFTPSPNHTTANTTSSYAKQHNSTITTSNTTMSTFTPSPNHTAAYNVTTTSSYAKQHKSTITTTNTTMSTFTFSPNDTTVNNVTTATKNYTTASSNYTTVDNVTTVDNNGNQQNGTTTASNTTTSTFTTPNPTVVYNVTRAANNYTTEYNVTTPSNNYTTNYNVMTTDNNNSTITTSNATTSTFTPSPNSTMANNVTTATNNYTTHFKNYTTQYNVSTADNIRNLQNGTTINTTISTFTPSPNHTEVYNKTTTSSYAKQHNSTITTTNTTMSTFTTSPNYTMVNNVTTATKNYTTAFNNYTTVDNNGNQQNATATSNTTVSTYTTSPKPTVVYNATTAASNYTTQYNVTTATNNYTTEYNVTTPDNIRNLQNGTTTTSNTTFSTFTPSPNHTADYNLTTTSSHVKQHNSTITTTNTTMSTFTTSPNYTMASKITTATKNYTTAFTNHTTVYNTTADNNNGTITTSNTIISTFTPSPNYTTVNNATTVSHKYTTAENVTTTTVSQNKRTTYNVTTTTPHKNMTMPTAETLNNATTSTKNSAVDNVTAVVDNTTKPTVAPLNNQTANHTTARVTYITATSKNDTSSTTAANGSINHNETAGTGLNLSTTASSLTTDLNLTTKRPVISLTTTVPSTTHGPPSATTTTTTTGTTATTTATTTITTTTITSASTTATIPATETTSTPTAKTTQSQEAQEEAANELLEQTQDASQLNSSQMAQLAGQLEKLLDGPTVPQAVGQKAVNIISNLMEGDSLALTASANRLIRAVDDLGLKLVVTGDKEIVSSNSLVLAVRTVDGTNFPTTSVDIFNTDNVQLSGVSRSRFKRSGSALGSVYLPSSLTTGLSPEEQQQASRVQFTYYTKSALFQDATLDNQTFVSPILGSSVANLSISNLSENIRFTIRNINPLQENYTASCVYWDFTLNDGRGGWSSNGCFVVNATPEDTTCSCNHLTSFAILLDLSRDGLMDRQQAQILTFVTYIGCGLSAIFLAVTLLTYLSFEKLLRDIPAKILVQLCISLLFLNLLFLLDGWLALYPATGLCISTAFFLHYFLLTSFTWAGLEALHMYLSVIQVFTPYLSRYMLKFSLMGWGIPLIVVIVVISVDKDNYGLVTYGKYTDGTTDDFCWLRNDIAFYVAVVGYFVLIFALCLLVFIMVMVQLARIKRQNPQNQSPNRGVMTDMRSIAGLVILLGLTWGFALFAWGPLYLPFVYLFTIFNTLQGFLVFVFHCAVKENVRRQWRTYLCCGRLRLAENSDWSRTATQNTRNMSMATATTSAPRHPSRTSSVISDGTNSNGSLFLDSGISDGTGSDVVLNEIHRQNMSL